MSASAKEAAGETKAPPQRQQLLLRRAKTSWSANAAVAGAAGQLSLLLKTTSWCMYKAACPEARSKSIRSVHPPSN